MIDKNTTTTCLKSRKKTAVSIVMMTTFSGNRFKGKQMPKIVNELEHRGLFSDGFGLFSATDKTAYTTAVRRKIHSSGLARFLLLINGKVCKLFKYQYRYLMNEKLFSLVALFFAKPKGDIVLLKHRPSWAISFYQKRGKRVVLELSENHPGYTYDAYKRECDSYSIALLKNTYTNQRAIKDVEKALLLADGFICLSEFSAKTYIDAGVPIERIKICALKTGCTRIHKVANLKSKTTFFCTANHSLLKGTHHLIDLWMKKRYENDLVIIGGMHPEFDPLIEQAKDNIHIIFKGIMSYDDMVDLYSNCRGVGVLLSISESWGRSAYEYLGASMPVIVSPTCISGVVQDGLNGYIVKTEDDVRLEKVVENFIYMDAESFESMRLAAFNSTMDDTYCFEKTYVEALQYFAGGNNE